MTASISTMIDLCAGIGGFSLAGSQAGLQTVYALDRDPKCALTYRDNFPDVYHLGDLHTQTDEIIARLRAYPGALLTAGFPCQPFSRAGRKEGFAAAQGGLFFDLVKIIAALRPPVVLLENVAHLQRHQGGRTFATMLQTISATGYTATYAVLNARDISGLPQNRHRLYLVGWREATRAARFNFPPASDNFLPFSSVLEPDPDQCYYLSAGSPVTRKILAARPVPGRIYTWRHSYLRAAEGSVCPTLLAQMGTGGYNVPLIVDAHGLRQLTVRECARLQGFGESFRFPETLTRARCYQQLGNSISVPTVRRIIEAILAA